MERLYPITRESCVIYLKCLMKLLSILSVYKVIIYPENIKYLNYNNQINLRPCRPKCSVLQAAVINRPFKIKKDDDGYAIWYDEGKAGDCLMINELGNAFVCKKHIFEECYEWLNKVKNDHIFTTDSTNGVIKKFATKMR